jgi:hypothetical protein
MASERVALEETPYEQRSWLPADEFVYGRPATRLQNVTHEIVSFVDLFRISRDEDAEPLGIAFVKLATLVIVGIAAAAAVTYALATLAARAFFGFAS